MQTEHENLDKVEAHLYTALNDCELGDEAHEHIGRAYRLLHREGGGGNNESLVDDPDIHGSFVDRELYPEYDELHQRVKKHASKRFGTEGIDTSPETWDIVYVGLEDGVVLYKVEHETLGEPVIE